MVEDRLGMKLVELIFKRNPFKQKVQNKKQWRGRLIAVLHTVKYFSMVVAVGAPEFLRAPIQNTPVADWLAALFPKILKQFHLVQRVTNFAPLQVVVAVASRSSPPIAPTLRRFGRACQRP